MGVDPIATEGHVAGLIEQLGRATIEGAFKDGLNPAQWAALRFFDRANRFSRTVGAFAEYQGATRGTTSRTVKALVAKGYLKRRATEGDGRSFRLDLTAKARRSLPDDPIRGLMSAAAGLSPDQRSALTQALEEMLSGVLVKQGRDRFGVCSYCMHLLMGNGRADSHCTYECELYGTPLSAEETEKICANYVAA